MTQEAEGSTLLKAVQAAAISPASAKKVVANLRRAAAIPRKGERPEDYNRRVAPVVGDAIVSRYSKLAATSGGVTALAGIIPGIGTLVSALGGGLADTVVCMKLQVDMCFCLAEAFGWDLDTEDARHLSFLIAAGGTLEQAGVEVGARVASKAGVSMLRQYLKGAALQAIKEFFKRLGLVFTRKAVERALPFGVGVALGASANLALTRYVGGQAKKWFILDQTAPKAAARKRRRKAKYRARRPPAAQRRGR